MDLMREDHVGVNEFLRDLESGVERAAPTGVSSGSIGYGGGGPVYLDAFKSKRPPTYSELVNAFKGVSYACINLNANAVAKVPLRLYCRTGTRDMKPRAWDQRRLKTFDRDRLKARLWANGVTRGLCSTCDEIDEITDCAHPLLATLSNPNPYFDGHLLIQHLARSLDCIGQAFWYPERIGSDFAPSELWPLHSQYVFPIKGSGREVIARWLYFGDEIPFEDLLWFRFVSLRDPYMSGYAPLHACFEQAGLVDYYTATMESILKNGARPEAIIGPKDGNQPWSPEQRKRMEVNVNSRFGASGQNKIYAVDGSYTFTPLTYPPVDLGGKDISQYARLVCANCFDVPISMLETESSNKATASEGSIQHQRNAVEPRCTLIGAVFTKLVQRIDPRLFMAFDNPVQEDKKTNAEVDQIYLKCGVKVPDEVRAGIGLEPRADGKGGEPIQAKPKKPAPGKDDDE